MTSAPEIRDIDVTKTWVLESTLNFTRYFFKHNFGKKFIVNDHHKIICDALDRVIQGKTKRLMINLAPRYSKTELVIKNFAAYGFGINPASKFIHLSYSADLATDNSTEVQNTVTSEPFQQLFDLELTSNSKKKWKTTEEGGFYAISSGGQVTGFGAGEVQELDEEEQKELEDKELQEIEEFIPFFDSKFAGAILIDDPIKPDDALSDTKRNAVNLKFDTTIRNRVNSRDTPIIIIMQRLHVNDLCGYLQDLEGVIGKDEDGEWELVELPCLTTDPETGEDVALWPHKHTVEELQKMRLKNPFVFETQYQMNPKPKEGLMYERGFREYDYPTIPYTPNNIKKNYTDTADTGADYLCSINYVESDLGNFVTDVLFTTKPMEYTEVKTAEMLAKENIAIANIESNNGGRSFARNVETQTRVLGNYTTEFNAFHQSENKNVRIFTKSNEVQNLTFFPRGWQNMWPEFYQHVTTYMKTGNNKHDDGCFVAGTNVATLSGNKKIENIKKGDLIITPLGIRKVLNCGQTGVKKVIENVGLNGTPEHKIFSSTGLFISLENCTISNIHYLTFQNLLLWRFKNLLSSMERSTDLWGRENIIYLNQKPILGESVRKDFMLRFGNFITKKQYRKAFVFTIKIIIHLITTSLIWSVFHLGNIYRIMGERIKKIHRTERKTLKISTKLDLKQQNGTEAQKAENGIVKTLKTWSYSQKIFVVQIVRRILNPCTETLSFAAINAVSSIGQSTKGLSIQENVLSAQKNSKQPKSNRQSQIEQPAHVFVQANCLTVPVYDLTVEKDHVYYANGILVSNCDTLTGMVEMRGQSEGDSAEGYFY